MMSNGTAESTVVKARYLNDIRKAVIRHNHDVTFNDLSLMLQRIFNISPNLPIHLKYRDSEGDFVTLTDDNDLLLALQTESSLFINLSVSSENAKDTEEIAKSLSCIQSCVDKLNTSLAALALYSPRESNGGCCASKSKSPEPAPLSPIVPPATIQPSIHEQAGVDVRNDHLSTATSLEEEIHLGGEAASEVTDYGNTSIPSFPQATAPPPSFPSVPPTPPTVPSIPQSLPSQPLQSAYTPQVAPSQAPPSSFAPPPSSYAPPPQSYAPLPVQSFPPQNVPPTSVSQYAPPPSSVSQYPPSCTPQQYAPPPSSIPASNSYPSQYSVPPSSVAPPSQLSTPPTQFVGAPPPSSQYGVAPPTFAGGFAPPPVGGGNPFARPPTEYRQSPYHHQ